MKELGIDGLFRGDFLEVFMEVKYPLEILPLDVGSLYRSGGLEQ